MFGSGEYCDEAIEAAEWIGLDTILEGLLEYPGSPGYVIKGTIVKAPKLIKQIPSLWGKVKNGASKVKNYFAGSSQGYQNFSDLKKTIGSAGTNKAWHHIVEQSQIQRSGFSATDIHNVNNVIAVPSGYRGSVHSQISGYYSSIRPFTDGMTVRDWLGGQSFEKQFEFGLNILKQYGTVKQTEKGLIFTPFN